MESNKKRQAVLRFLAMAFLEMVCVISMVFIISPNYLFFPTVVLLIICFGLGGNYFHNKEKFDEDSIYLLSTYIFPVLLLIGISIVGVYNKGMQKNLKIYTEYATLIILVLCLYFFIIYFFRGMIVIREIRGDEHLFITETVKSLLHGFLIFAAASIVIMTFSEKNYASLTYQLSNIFVNSILLFIDMFVYVRSEINEFEKQEKEKMAKEKKEKIDEQKYEMDKKEHSEVNETDVLNKETNGKNKEKIQYYDVEEFVDKLGTKKELNKLKNKIKKRKKKLKKERFSDSKRYVNKFASLEDLDNLEKIITEKRKDLEH